MKKKFLPQQTLALLTLSRVVINRCRHSFHLKEIEIICWYGDHTKKNFLTFMPNHYTQSRMRHN